MFLMILRWFGFLTPLLATEYFGESVLPAFQATVSSESLRFLAYMALVFTGSTHAYWTLPIGGSSFLTTFVRLFRLEALADFDLLQLEGQNEFMNMTTGEIGVKGVSRWHSGVGVLFVGCAICVTIISMNVYIAILSQKYEGYRERCLQLFSHTRVQVMFPLYLRRKFWLWWGCDLTTACLRPLLLCMKYLSGFGHPAGHYDGTIQSRKAGVWVCALCSCQRDPFLHPEHH